MIVNHIEQILADAGIRASVEWQDNGLWKITEIHWVASNVTVCFHAPMTIPSMQPELWLAAIISGDTETAHKLELGLES